MPSATELQLRAIRRHSDALAPRSRRRSAAPCAPVGRRGGTSFAIHRGNRLRCRSALASPHGTDAATLGAIQREIAGPKGDHDFVETPQVPSPFAPIAPDPAAARPALRMKRPSQLPAPAAHMRSPWRPRVDSPGRFRRGHRDDHGVVSPTTRACEESRKKARKKKCIGVRVGRWRHGDAAVR